MGGGRVGWLIQKWALIIVMGWGFVFFFLHWGGLFPPSLKPSFSTVTFLPAIICMIVGVGGVLRIPPEAMEQVHRDFMQRDDHGCSFDVGLHFA